MIGNRQNIQITEEQQRILIRLVEKEAEQTILKHLQNTLTNIWTKARNRLTITFVFGSQYDKITFIDI